MNETTSKVYQDLILKSWYSVSKGYCENLKQDFLVGKQQENSFKKIVLALPFDKSISHTRLALILKYLNLSGDINEYQEGILLAIVGGASNIVYHRINPGITNF